MSALGQKQPLDILAADRLLSAKSGHSGDRFNDGDVLRLRPQEA